MKATTTSVFDILSRLRIDFQGGKALYKHDSDEPLLSELYNMEQLGRHGEVLARSHKLLKEKSPDQLLKRLDSNEKTLLEVRKLLVESIRFGKIVTPAAEWLLDNFYLIEEQIVIARKHLPKGYSEDLPYLKSENLTSVPRVYDIVLEIISHSDGRVDVKSLISFVAAYQKITLLTLGELWAIPIMLRLAVIENLRRVARKIATDMIDHVLADYWAEKMTLVAEKEPGNLILTIADMARSKPPLTSPFVAGLTRKLLGKGPALAMSLSWMEQQLSGMGLTTNDLIWQENHKQAADQVSVRNSIGTLRFLGAMDWREFVEKLSSVEQVLRKDISGTYPNMDFSTRDRYRHVVETIAKRSLLSETEVAKKVLELAGKHSDNDKNHERRKHIGYYLIDKGLKQAEQAAGMRYTLKQKLVRFIWRMPVTLYLLSIVLLSVLAAALMTSTAYSYGFHNQLLLALLGLLSLSASSQLAISLVNWLSAIWVTPRLLPRMDFSKGIPVEFRTLVVVPTMLSGKEYIEELIEALEIRYLANKEANLHFGLLTDFMDADAEIMPGDDDLLQLVNKSIAELNQKYYQPEEEIFFLFHRPRIWNPKEMKWMGYERKRGKLAALNAFILGRSKDEFSLVTGNYRILTNVKYVITLDSDTMLPREAAWKFIATMAHPLNQAVYNERKKRVTEGYGILQPRVGASLPKGNASLYLHLQGNVTGIDPYTRVSSDVYQDLFGEGSYIGKGIYDVEIFEKAVNKVFPENRILSHDLIEGCYSRSGLISDVLLYDENPSTYNADIKRHHRWIRGDWQIGAWMLPFISNSKGRLTKNRLSLLSRWKIFDNLRRSLFQVTILLLLLLGWVVLPDPLFWTLSVLFIYLFPDILEAIWKLIHKPADLTFKAHFSDVGISFRDTVIRLLFNIAVLPYEAFKFSDAILRTNLRLFITRKKLLQWTPSANATQNTRNDVWSVYRTMWIAPVLALLFTGLLIYTNPDVLFIASPILLFWFFVPALAWEISKPEIEKVPKFSADQTLFLNKTARRIWSFFELFVTVEDNWLPPDNYQMQPKAILAHRTSPTNIGLSLLANLTAYDFGYISGGELALRCSNTMHTMYKMERYKGHFYNWYDTRSLSTLQPRYVSTVDSGNLSGHLLVLRQGLLALPDQPLFSRRNYEGLITTAMIIRDHSEGHHTAKIDKILELLKVGSRDVSSLSIVKNQLDKLIVLSNELTVNQAGSETILYKWSNRLLQQVQLIKDDLVHLLPWLEFLPTPEQDVHSEITDIIPSLLLIKDMSDQFDQSIEKGIKQEYSQDEKKWQIKMRELLALGNSRATERILMLEQLATHCEQMSDVKYDFLFDRTTKLLRIGYNVDDHRKDNSFYDLLASEARLGVFVAIAQGKLPQESWFALGRLLTNSGGAPILLSWSGSMFEYLMPQLVMPSFDNTLLYQTNKATVKRQIEYGSQRGIPWGISESGYNMVDASMNYQYRAFGVPGLGLKRGLEEDLVVAPYASLMALMVSPLKACTNLQLMSEEGFEGEYGFFEAIDYTKSRLPRGETHIVVNSYMVHHQGMGLLSLAYLLLDKPMQRRFVSELRFQATLLLLQERIPKATIFYAHTADIIEAHALNADVQIRSINTPNTRMPEIQLLSNGRYQVMITNSGGGYTRWKDLAVTRWREDATKDDRGIFCYIKDTGTGKFWSNTFQPTQYPAKDYEAVFSQGRVEFRRQDFGIVTKTEIVVSPEDDSEMRRIQVTNKNTSVKVLEITSYAEVVMATQASDEAHPAFSNLFVQTEILSDDKAILCSRRPRSKEEIPPWMFHHMDAHNTTVESISYETDRMQFIGRGNTTVHPQAMDSDLLSGSQGSVLDPIVAIRYRISIKPNQTAIIDLIYGISDTKESCEFILHKYQDRYMKRRSAELSWTHSQVLLRQIRATEADAQMYNRLASSVIFSNPDLRAESSVIQSNYRGQSGLWSHSVSGDLPIVLLRIYDTESMDLVRQMVQAHAYWRLKGLAVDLVIWNEDYGSYRQLLQEQIMALIASEAVINPVYSLPGNIFVKSADQLSNEDRILFESIARVIIYDNKGTLSEQINQRPADILLPQLLERKPVTLDKVLPVLKLPENLLFFNGTGGFTPDGKEYKILTDNKTTTLAPWVNVIANPDFGTVISENGSAYTWAVNAHEYRLTPWSNDPVSDAGGEAFYLRDEELGIFWSPSPYPKKGTTPYVITHGFGYSTFEHSELGISSEMTVFVDKKLPVKFIVIKIKNLSGRERILSATGFMEIILGDVRSKTNMHVISEQVGENGALLFRNRYNSTFADRIAYFKVDGVNLGFNMDRSVFIGRNRSLEDPQAMYRKKLSGRSGAGLDPCASLQLKFELHDGEEKEIVFQLGNGGNIQTVNELISEFVTIDSVMQSLQNVKDYWNDVLGAVQVTTPDNSLNILANGWLAYQTIACRIFARSGFYQSGGAFGFRDQLQDVLALLQTQPGIAREQILLSASRQFAEGDVQHWWHPPEGRGVRTHCSDDMLWLPFVVSRYLSATGDSEILSVPVGFLECRQLQPGEDSLYDLPVSGNLSGALYDHCVRAITHSLRFGEHGLPFMGSGDWNDGMDKVGNEGLGESVWLAFFLYDVLNRFADVAAKFGDTVFAETCKKVAATLQASIEASAWDGEWYKRAWFDDGKMLGSKGNTECRIDAIAQSWSVLSGAANDERKVMAMASLDKNLVKRDLKLIQLLDPPFDLADGLNPGYIKGYVPGVRENGGQYSHAAIWTLMAFAKLGDRKKVWELFSMIHPINHSSNAADMQIYKVEPYVMAADVYANESHRGRGGWTWYTGSSGWMYQFIVGSLVGMELQSDQLKFRPCFPVEWPSVSIVYRFGKSTYRITVFQSDSNEESHWKMGNDQGKGDAIKLTDDGQIYEAEVHIRISE